MEVLTHKNNEKIEVARWRMPSDKGGAWMQLRIGSRYQTREGDQKTSLGSVAESQIDNLIDILQEIKRGKVERKQLAQVYTEGAPQASPQRQPDAGTMQRAPQAPQQTSWALGDDDIPF
jgi:single-stranded DNA-binding protein